jgi:NitT/TauT family transport system substrate-binding protein
MRASRHARGMMLRLACALLLLIAALARPAASDEITVTQWKVGLYGVPYAVAMDKGFFKAAGIDVTGILGSQGGGTSVRNLLASPTPYGEVALSAAIAARREGLPLVIVNTGTRHVAEFVWVTMPNSPVRTIQDFAGKKIGYTNPKSVTEMLLIMALQANGLKPDAVQRIATGGYGPGLTALEQGGVASAPIIEPNWTARKDRYRPVFFATDVLPPMTSTVGVTTLAFAKANPDKIRAIVDGRRRGVDFVYAQPAEAARITAAAYDLDPAVAVESVRNMADAKTWSPGDFELQNFDRMAEGLRVIGELDGAVDWKTLLDDQFLPADLRGTR